MAGVAQGFSLLDQNGNPLNTSTGLPVNVQVGGTPGGTVANPINVVALSGAGGTPLFSSSNPGSVLAGNPIGAQVPLADIMPVSEEIVGVQVSASNTGAAAAAVSATLPGVASKTTYIRGLVVSTTNPAAAVSGLITVTGTISGTLNFQFVESATQGGLLIITFGNAGLAASGANTAIVVNLPAITSGGAGAVTAWGVQL